MTQKGTPGAPASNSEGVIAAVLTGPANVGQHLSQSDVPVNLPGQKYSAVAIASAQTCAKTHERSSGSTTEGTGTL